MRMKFSAALAAVAFILATPPAALADWKDTLARAVAGPLVNKAVNYLFSERHAPLASPKKQPAKTTATRTVPSRTARVPVPPSETDYITPIPSMPVPSKSTKLEVPPPPKMMIPPPPPAVPTGAILGMYPDQLSLPLTEVARRQMEKNPTPTPVAPKHPTNNHNNHNNSDNNLPKTAPDFHRTHQ